jgi:hypothetical protein
VTATVPGQKSLSLQAEADAERAGRLAYIRARCEEVRKRALAVLKATANCKTLDGRRISVRS